MRRAAVVALVVTLAACDSERVDPLELFAASACASVQTWVDAIEDDTTALSRAVTSLDTQEARVPHYRVYARGLVERTDDLRRQLRRLAPARGDGRVAADHLLAAIEKSHAITEELVVLADGFPDTGDGEDLTSRISSLLVRLEKAFSHPAHARDELARRYDAFADAPACVDYDEPVT